MYILLFCLFLVFLICIVQCHVFYAAATQIFPKLGSIKYYLMLCYVILSYVTRHMPFLISVEWECFFINYLCFCGGVFRRCVPRWTVPRPKETQCWSGLREHSSAGKSRSRNSARQFLTVTRCLVKHTYIEAALE